MPSIASVWPITPPAYRESHTSKFFLHRLDRLVLSENLDFCDAYVKMELDGPVTNLYQWTVELRCRAPLLNAGTKPENSDGH